MERQQQPWNSVWNLYKAFRQQKDAKRDPERLHRSCFPFTAACTQGREQLLKLCELFVSLVQEKASAWLSRGGENCSGMQRRGPCAKEQGLIESSP
ncbi:hypothetical protein JZ751_026165 [Albula glossodonta]|uniref:Uncharacterized protein n=1 Tax=Albula glossodonta TaxID=121402 RepID=A0A8T2PJI2_9TELE|nr:hypothetical protein JZ751_026165 [Albula glossodonta]